MKAFGRFSSSIEARCRRRAIAAAAALFAMPGAAGAASIAVTGACTLSDAISAANADAATGGCPAGSGADTLVLAASSTMLLSTESLPAISSVITIEGHGARIERSAGAAPFRLLSVTATGNLTLNDLTLANGSVTGSAGGAVRSEGRLVLNRSTVTGSRSTGAGGGIAVVSGSFELNDSTVSGNTAGGNGGGLILGSGESGRITSAIRNSTISGNVSDGNGGGLNMRVNSDGLLQTIEHSTISNNRSGSLGGGIHSTDTLTITNSTISGNTAALYGGGGIYHRLGPLILRDSTVAGNEATTYGGGGIATRRGGILLVNSTVSGNTAGEFDGGGGIFHAGDNGEGYLRLRYSTVSGNSAREYGGGIFSGVRTTLSQSQITGNSAYLGAGGIYSRERPLVIRYSSVSDNVAAGGDGGGILSVSEGATLTIANSTVSGNRALVGSGGGVLASFDIQGDISNSTISGNTASDVGGGVLIRRNTLAIRNSTITGNVAQSTDSSGGGIYRTGRGVLTLGRNIIAGNDAPNSPDSVGREIDSSSSASVVSEGFNVLGSSAFSSSQAFHSFNPAASDRIATSNGTQPTAIGDILVTGFGNNGGPTRTHNLRGASPARDFIPSSLCVGQIDQRGVVRPKDGRNGQPDIGSECDAGAVEASGINAVDLSISQTSNGPVYVGEPLSFSITVRNDGAEPANGIEIYDALPAALRFVSATDSDDTRGECGEVLGTVACRLQRLDPSEAFIFEVQTATTVVGAVTNTASFINDTLINTNVTGTDFDATVMTQVLGRTVTLTAAPTTISETGGSATVTAALSAASTVPVTVTLLYSGTASEADNSRPTSITIPAGALSATATITATPDLVDEDDETIIVTLGSTPTGMIGSPNSATITIADDDLPPTVTFDRVSQTVDEGAGAVTLSANLSAASSRNIVVPLTFAGSATSGVDYSASATEIVIPAGALTGSVTLTLTDDALDEDNETVDVIGSNPNVGVDPTGGGITTFPIFAGIFTLTIVDNDAAPTVTLAAAPASISEASGQSTLTASLSTASGLPVTVDLAYAGTAGPSDSSRPASISIPAGAISGTATVTATQDALVEGDETVTVSISGATNGTVGSPGSASIVILDDDVAPDATPDAFSFVDASNVEPGSLQTSAPITVSGIDTAISASVTGGFYSLNGGPCTLSSGTVVNGDSIRVCHTASASFSTATSTTLTLGANGVLIGVSDTFTSTTRAAVQSPTLSLDVNDLHFGRGFVLRFRDLTLNTSEQEVVTLSNTGNAPLSIAGIVTTGDFRHTTTCGPTVAPMSQCTISIVFRPTAVGPRTGETRILSNAASSPDLISLSGTGKGLVPGIKTNVSRYDFGTVAVGSSSQDRALIITSSGTGPLEIRSIRVSGDYSGSHDCPKFLDAGKSCTLTGRFKPKAKGTRTGEITITTSAPNSPTVVALTGKGS